MVLTAGSGKDRPSRRYIPMQQRRGAAEQLLKWTKRGPKWHSAVQLCMDAMIDQVKPEVVRRAFLEAAKEEGKLLPP